jgi:hypothetical protein
VHVIALDGEVHETEGIRAMPPRARRRWPRTHARSGGTAGLRRPAASRAPDNAGHAARAGNAPHVADPARASARLPCGCRPSCVRAVRDRVVGPAASFDSAVIYHSSKCVKFTDVGVITMLAGVGNGVLPVGPSVVVLAHGERRGRRSARTGASGLRRGQARRSTSATTRARPRTF